MKKIFSLFSGLCLLIFSYGQNTLHQIIRNPGKNISKFYTDFSQNNNVSFTASNASALFGLDAKSNLIVQEKDKDVTGNDNYRLIQTYNNIPVENSMYIVHTKSGKLVSASGYIVTEFNKTMEQSEKTSITKDNAIQLAIKYAGAEQYMWQIPQIENELKQSSGNSKATYYPNSVTKVWYNSEDQLNPSALKLAYKIDVYSAKPFSRAYYFVDAATGAFLGKKDRLNTSDAVGKGNTLYCGAREIHSDKKGDNLYILHDNTRGGGVVTVSGSLSDYGNNYTSNSANWNLKMPDQNAMDAHWGVAQTYDFYKINFNRNSYDDKGSELKSYVNYWLWSILTNASWDGNSMQFGQRFPSNKGVTAIDVTGHELTHGVTQSSSGLNYSGETGGMNESMSDIFGKAIQFYSRPDDINWQIGNEMNWVIRDMSNPNFFQQPDTYNGTYWKSNADVHILSGVGNYFYYLLSTGGSGTNDLGNAFNVHSIGVPKATNILYRTNTVYLTPTSNYADWREACIQAARDLYGSSSNEVKQVKNAWYAVGVGDAANVIAYMPANNLSVINIFPNPVVNSAATVNFTLEAAGNIVLKMSDVSGLPLRNTNLGYCAAGKNSYLLSKLETLKNGSYYITLEKNGVVSAKSMLIVSH